VASEWVSCKTYWNRQQVTSNCGHIKQRPYSNSEIFHLISLLINILNNIICDYPVCRLHVVSGRRTYNLKL